MAGLRRKDLVRGASAGGVPDTAQRAARHGLEAAMKWIIERYGSLVWPAMPGQMWRVGRSPCLSEA
jgi:hypothetical protein